MFSVFAASRETTRNRVPYIGLVIIKYTQCIYGMFGREITKYMVIYSAYIRFLTTLATQLSATTTRAVQLHLQKGHSYSASKE
jgi:hypothetical protein